MKITHAAYLAYYRKKLMKALLFVLAFVIATYLFAGLAQATDLYSTPGFGYLHQYQNVPNSDGLNINIYPPTNTSITGGTLLIDGVGYTCQPFIPAFSTCVSFEGDVVTLSIVETKSAPFYVGSGRGRKLVSKWTLVSGEIQ